MHEPDLAFIKDHNPRGTTTRKDCESTKSEDTVRNCMMHLAQAEKDAVLKDAGGEWSKLSWEERYKILAARGLIDRATG